MENTSTTGVVRGGNDPSAASMEAFVRLGVSVQRFRNVDLFEKGFYSIKCFVDVPSPGRVIDAKLETATAENIVSGGDAAAMYPGSLLRKKGTGFKTQTCEIKYSDDEFDVHTGMSCALLFPAPLGDALPGAMAQCSALLRFELHFNARDPLALKCVSTKTLRLHEIATRGVLEATAVEFDFFHTCSIDIAVFALLVGFSEWRPREAMQPRRSMSLPVALRPPAPPHQHPHGGDGGGGGGGGADRGAANGLVSRRVGLGGTSRYSAGGIPEEETGDGSGRETIDLAVLSFNTPSKGVLDTSSTNLLGGDDSPGVVMDGSPERRPLQQTQKNVKKMSPEGRGIKAVVTRAVSLSKGGPMVAGKAPVQSRLSYVVDDVDAIVGELNEATFYSTSYNDLSRIITMLGDTVERALTSLASLAFRAAAEADNSSAVCDLASNASHAAHIASNTAASERESWNLDSREGGCCNFDEFCAAVSAVNAQVYEVANVLWRESLGVLLWDPPLLCALRRRHRQDRVYRLLHGGFVWEQPLRALPKVRGERGQNLLAIGARVRGCRHFSVFSPPSLEDTTESVHPKLGPMLFEYRYHPSVGNGRGSRGRGRGGALRGRRGGRGGTLGRGEAGHATGDGRGGGGGGGSRGGGSRGGGSGSDGNGDNGSCGDDDKSASVSHNTSSVTAGSNSCPSSPSRAAGVHIVQLPTDAVKQALPLSFQREFRIDLDEPDGVTQRIAEMRAHVGPAATFLEQAAPSHPELRLPTHSATGLCAGGRRHLVVCVHGLEGNQYDLRLVRLQLQKAFPRMVFMMSSANTSNTHASFSHMTDIFVAELDAAIKKHAPRRVSFIGHSLGNLIIRSALARQEVQAMFDLSGKRAANHSLSKSTADGPTASSQHSGLSAGAAFGEAGRNSSKPILTTYVSFAGPHAGAIYLGGMVSTGLWFMSRWKRSSSLSSLSWGDHSDPRQTFIYQLSKTNSMQLFRNVVLVASPQDKYVNIASALLHSCPQSAMDARLGRPFEEAITNLIGGLLQCGDVNVARLYMTLAPGPKSMASIIGRAAHIAVLDEELVAQKVTAAIAHYFDDSDDSL